MPTKNVGWTSLRSAFYGGVSCTMQNILLRGLGLISALGGLAILLFFIQVFQQGFFSSLSLGSIIIIVSLSLLRVMFLIACGWAAWRIIQYAPWFSFGAFVTFSFGGAAEGVYRLGFIVGLTNLIPTYYLMASVHLIVTLVIWWLVRSLESAENDS